MSAVVISNLWVKSNCPQKTCNIHYKHFLKALIMNTNNNKNTVFFLLCFLSFFFLCEKIRKMFISCTSKVDFPCDVY